jgi:hypothetical protein
MGDAADPVGLQVAQTMFHSMDTSRHFSLPFYYFDTNCLFFFFLRPCIILITLNLIEIIS